MSPPQTSPGFIPPASGVGWMDEWVNGYALFGSGLSFVRTWVGAECGRYRSRPGRDDGESHPSHRLATTQHGVSWVA